MRTGEDIERRLRYRILGLLHAGQLHPGDRLPSIRELVQETGADHRVVSRAYHALAAEGLVEIRPGSGMYVSREETGAAAHSEATSWLADVLLGGWERRLGRMQVGDAISRCASVRLRCACIESNQDHMTALVGELEDDFALDVMPVMISSGARAGTLDPERLDGTHLVVSTVFHADAARAVAARAGLPFVLLSLDSAFAAEIDRRLREGPQTAVVVDVGFAARGEAYFAVTGHQGRVRYVLADRVEAEGVSPDDPTVLLTRAARRRLGLEDYHLLPPPMRVISVDSARELFRIIVSAGMAQTWDAGGTQRSPPAGADGERLPT